MKKIYLVIRFLCFYYLLYKGFVLFLKWALDAQYITFDPKLWAVLIICAACLEYTSKD